MLNNRMFKRCLSRAPLIAVLVFVLLTMPAAADAGSLIPLSDPSQWAVTEAEAIAIASSYVPPIVLEQAQVHTGAGCYGNFATGENVIYRDVSYSGFTVTREELGWQEDENTELGPEPFQTIEIRINADTGELIWRHAMAATGLPVVFGPVTFDLPPPVTKMDDPTTLDQEQMPDASEIIELAGVAAEGEEEMAEPIDSPAMPEKQPITIPEEPALRRFVLPISAGLLAICALLLGLITWNRFRKSV